MPLCIQLSLVIWWSYHHLNWSGFVAFLPVSQRTFSCHFGCRVCVSISRLWDLFLHHLFQRKNRTGLFSADVAAMIIAILSGECCLSIIAAHLSFLSLLLLLLFFFYGWSVQKNKVIDIPDFTLQNGQVVRMAHVYAAPQASCFVQCTEVCTICNHAITQSYNQCKLHEDVPLAIWALFLWLLPPMFLPGRRNLSFRWLQCLHESHPPELWGCACNHGRLNQDLSRFTTVHLFKFNSL